MANLFIWKESAEKRLITAIDCVQRSLEEFKRSVAEGVNNGAPAKFYCDVIKGQLDLVEWLFGEVDAARLDDIVRKASERRVVENEVDDGEPPVSNPVEKKKEEIKNQRERFLGNGFYESVSPYFEEKGKYLGENMVNEHVFVRRFAKDELPVFELVTATELEQPKDKEGVHRFMMPPSSGLGLKRRMVGARDLLCESTSDFNTWLCIADCDYLNSLGDYINRRLDALDGCLHTRKKRKKSRGCHTF